MKRSPGRPALDPDGQPARVDLTLPSREYDRIHAIARREGVSVPHIIRRGIARVRDDPSSDDD